MSCEHCKELEAKLEYYQTRGQRILDKLATAVEEKLDGGNLDASTLNVARQLMRDQGIIDLRSGATPVNHLKKQYPFPKPSDDAPDIGVREAAE